LVPHETENPEINQDFEDLERWTDKLIGEWLTLELVAALEFNASVAVPAIRLEDYGTSARFRGLLKVKAGKALPAVAVLFTIPKAYRPAKICTIPTILLGAPSAIFIQVNPNGEVQVNAACPEGSQIFLDGLTYSL
jgi:hypothetical protein